MLVIKVEIWPGGDKFLARQIGFMHIGNVSQLAEVSDYVVQTDGETRTEVRGHERSRGFWQLVKRAIQSYQDAKGEP